jgi:hypothetical protein
MAKDTLFDGSGMHDHHLGLRKKIGISPELGERLDQFSRHRLELL